MKNRETENAILIIQNLKQLGYIVLGVSLVKVVGNLLVFLVEKLLG